MKKKTIAQHFCASQSVLSQHYIDYVNCKTSKLNKMFVHIHYYRLHVGVCVAFSVYLQTNKTKKKEEKAKAEGKSNAQTNVLVPSFFSVNFTLTCPSSPFFPVNTSRNEVASFTVICVCVCVDTRFSTLCFFCAFLVESFLFSFEIFLLLLQLLLSLESEYTLCRFTFKHVMKMVRTVYTKCFSVGVGVVIVRTHINFRVSTVFLLSPPPQSVLALV